MNRPTETRRGIPADQHAAWQKEAKRRRDAECENRAPLPIDGVKFKLTIEIDGTRSEIRDRVRALAQSGLAHSRDAVIVGKVPLGLAGVAAVIAKQEDEP